MDVRSVDALRAVVWYCIILNVSLHFCCYCRINIRYIDSIMQSSMSQATCYEECSAYDVHNCVVFAFL